MILREHLLAALHYAPETGTFTWLIGHGRGRTKGIGSVAGSLDWKGYRRIRIVRRAYRAHQLAWLYVYGQWPGMQIDHINRQKDDNRIENLRLVTPAQNKWNSAAPKTNRSGFKGVFRRGDRWIASMCTGGKRKHLGVFQTAEAAHEAYAAAERTHRGEFGRAAWPTT